MSEEAIKLRNNTPELGPSGIVLQMPDRVHPLTLADLFEVLRWVHGDLKQIHAAFRHVDTLRRELEQIKIIHKKQEYAYRQQAERHSEVLERIGKQEQTIEAQSAEILTQGMIIQEAHRAIIGMQESLGRMEERILTPWWKRLKKRKFGL